MPSLRHEVVRLHGVVLSWVPVSTSRCWAPTPTTALPRSPKGTRLAVSARAGQEAARKAGVTQT